MTKKFRVWDLVGEKWMDVFEVNLLEHDYLNNPEYQIQQWTGLTDSQGVEIYEGDIVKASLLEEEIIKAVKYSREYASFLLGENALWQDWLGNSKIIGNIFQTPELLEKC